jgi:hypothetical protein
LPSRFCPLCAGTQPSRSHFALKKNHEIANLRPVALAEVSDNARRRLKFMQRRPKLIRGFWQQAELNF